MIDLSELKLIHINLYYLLYCSRLYLSEIYLTEKSHLHLQILQIAGRRGKIQKKNFSFLFCIAKMYMYCNINKSTASAIIVIIKWWLFLWKMLLLKAILCCDSFPKVQIKKWEIVWSWSSLYLHDLCVQSEKAIKYDCSYWFSINNFFIEPYSFSHFISDYIAITSLTFLYVFSILYSL